MDQNANQMALDFLKTQMTELETMNLEDDLEDSGGENNDEGKGITLAFMLIDQSNIKVDCQQKLEELEWELDLEIKNNNISKATIILKLKEFCVNHSYNNQFDPHNRFNDLVDLWYSRKCENYGVTPK